MESEESKQEDTWEKAGEKDVKRLDKIQSLKLQCIGKEAESFRSFLKSRFFDFEQCRYVSPQRELKTFIEDSNFF